MEKEIEQFFYINKIPVFGCCRIGDEEKSKIYLTEKIVRKINTAIVFGIPLSKGVIANLIDGPDLLYLHHYRQANYLLDKISYQLASLLEEKGYLSIPVPASQIIDWKKQKALLSHKYFACLCGLGWLGRNNLIVNSVYRSRLRFTTVLTELVIEKTNEVVEFGCGNCKNCVRMCPAGAISEKAEQFDHIKCFEKIKEMTKKKNISQYICGLCIKACEKWD
ncbi:MAG: hypothetical protein NC906_08705 [Candidatus Omnitrophica bacterium]|nr:hypothetical protein [Candidatus Omnitrophota bacterium]